MCHVMSFASELLAHRQQERWPPSWAHSQVWLGSAMATRTRCARASVLMARSCWAHWVACSLMIGWTCTLCRGQYGRPGGSRC